MNPTAKNTTGTKASSPARIATEPEIVRAKVTMKNVFVTGLGFVKAVMGMVEYENH
jgi:hypothetical protein